MLIYFSDEIYDIGWSFELASSDENFVNDTWYREDRLLVDLSNQEPFVGKTTWSDLELIHFQILILKCYDHIKKSAIMNSPHFQYSEPFISFRFLASAFVKFSSISGMAGFELVSFTRKHNGNLAVELSTSHILDMKTPEKPKRPVLRLVVDNS